MSTKDKFSYSVSSDKKTGWSVVTMKYNNPEDSAQSKSVKICPEAGANLFSFIIGGQEIIYQPPSIEELRNIYFGTLVLYPTPNRVRSCMYEYMGEKIKQKKNGKDRFLHGFVYDEPFEFDEPLVSETGVTLKTRIRMTKETPFFASFPFENTLHLAFTLLKDKLRFEYMVENQSSKPLPYGFALHPYFLTFGERKDNFIQADVKQAFEAINLLPTGKLFDVKKTPQDICKLTSLEGLDLDQVYYGVTPETKMRLKYKNLGLQLLFKVSDDFTHLVVFTPKKKNFFCIENQTCSTDAHNLYNKGLKEISHLQIVKPGKMQGGWIEYVPKWVSS